MRRCGSSSSGGAPRCLKSTIKWTGQTLDSRTAASAGAISSRVPRHSVNFQADAEAGFAGDDLLAAAERNTIFRRLAVDGRAVAAAEVLDVAPLRLAFQAEMHAGHVSVARKGDIGPFSAADLEVLPTPRR